MKKTTLFYGETGVYSCRTEERGRFAMSEKRAELLLACVIIARSTSFVFNKLGLGTMTAFNLLAVRFLLAFVLLALLFWKRLRHISRRTAPRPVTLLSAAVALVGVALLTSGGGTFRLGAGECIALTAALVYACAIIATDRFTHRDDGFTLGILQVGFLGAYALVGSLLFEAPRLPQTGSEWGIILALAIVCTGFGYTLQPVAQSHTTAQRAGLFCALSPAFATIFGAVLLREKITPLGLVGILLILGSLLLPHFIKGKKCHDEVQSSSV